MQLLGIDTGTEGPADSVPKIADPEPLRYPAAPP
jgi:hypothetical protein